MQATTTVQERPILFSGPMVQAILRGEKTQTRRIYKHHRSDGGTVFVEQTDGTRWPYRSIDGESFDDGNGNEVPRPCPYGCVGDHLWVRETFSPMPGCRPIPHPEIYDSKPAWYRADNDRPMWAGTKWTPAIHMPRSCARIVLQITGVRVEQVRFISDEDAVAEGVADRGAFGRLWESIHGPDSWDWNPWVWVVEFERLQPAAR